MKNLDKTFLKSRKIGLFLILPLIILIISASQINLVVEPLNTREKEGLVYTLAEARLTRDVNKFLYAKWTEPIFDYLLTDENDNIYRIQKLIKRHGGQDPLAYSAEGKFSLPTLQKEYNKYVNLGKNNWSAAIYVSMTLEEKNYLKMQERIAESENLELIKVYGKRMKKSGNHIRVLYKNLGNVGIEYEPQFMERNEFSDLIYKDYFLDISNSIGSIKIDFSY
jgi:hypothetical protein